MLQRAWKMKIKNAIEYLFCFQVFCNMCSLANTDQCRRIKNSPIGANERESSYEPELLVIDDEVTLESISKTEKDHYTS